jgi:hypothetical protein
MGDDLRKVHWPSSAKTGDLVVRTEHIPEHGNSLVLLDVRTTAADPETFEEMVSAAASIVVACRERGDRIRMVTTDGVDLVADSPAACDAILDMLALVKQSKRGSASLPVRVGRSGVEAGALVVANDAEILIESMHAGSAGARGTYVVRFHRDGPTTNPNATRLTSTHMIDIQPGHEFAAAWARKVGR